MCWDCTSVKGCTDKESKHSTLPSSHSSLDLLSTFQIRFCSNAVDFLVLGASGLLADLCITSYGCMQRTEAKSFYPYHWLSKHKRLLSGCRCLLLERQDRSFCSSFLSSCSCLHRHTQAHTPTQKDKPLVMPYLFSIFHVITESTL